MTCPPARQTRLGAHRWRALQYVSRPLFLSLCFIWYATQDKSQLPRPYEPVAKTLDSEADKENALDPESAHASESITPVEHEAVLADVTKAVEVILSNAVTTNLG